MIGICGFLRLDGAPASTEILASMQRLLARCGTPKFAMHAEGSLAMGATGWHATLPIDPAPALFRHAETGCVVVADARLEDRDALIRALGLRVESGWTDAALIGHAWLRHGEACVERLEGDFAFAAWDPRVQALFCARDRMGVRPLYFHHAPGRLLAFATGATSLLAHPQIPATLNEGRIADFLVSQLEGIDKTSTFHRDVERLPPASTLRVDAHARTIRGYWSLEPRHMPRLDDAGWAAAILEALEAAVTRQSGTKGRIGCMISGGLDSSSLAVIASRQLAEHGSGPLPVFSAVDRSGDCPETRAVDAMLALPGFDPSLVDVSNADALIGKLRGCYLDAEEPFDGIMSLAHAMYLSAAQKGVEAVIDGIDGDSVFLPGKSMVRDMRHGRWLQALRNARANHRQYPDGPSASRQLAGAAIRAVVPPHMIARIRHKPLSAHADDNVLQSLIAPAFARRIDLPQRLAMLRSHSAPDGLDAPREASWALRHPYITTAFERYHRTAAMHGIQPLHPFADRRLLELAVNLPDRQRQRNGWSKAVLREAMKGRLPDDVRLRRDKVSLGWKFNQRLLFGDFDWATRRLEAQRGLLAPYLALDKLNVHSDATPEAIDAAIEAVSLGAWLERIAAPGIPIP